MRRREVQIKWNCFNTDCCRGSWHWTATSCRTRGQFSTHPTSLRRNCKSNSLFPFIFFIRNSHQRDNQTGVSFEIPFVVFHFIFCSLFHFILGTDERRLCWNHSRFTDRSGRVTHQHKKLFQDSFSLSGSISTHSQIQRTQRQTDSFNCHCDVATFSECKSWSFCEVISRQHHSISHHYSATK